MHMNPASHYPQALIEAAGNVTDTKLLITALLAIGYAAIRLIEAYGLWHGFAWAEWFAIITGGMYLPLEVYEVVKKVTVVKVCGFVAKRAIVIYRIRARRR